METSYISPRISIIEGRELEPESSYNEYKYLVPHDYLSHCKGILDQMVGGLDPYPEGWVDSIYYDSPDEDLLGQCVNGEEHKWKFRIRGYGNREFNQVHLKIKDMSSVSKYKAKIDTMRLVSGQAPLWHQLRPVNDSDSGFASIMYYASSLSSSLWPSIRVKYYRYRYRTLDYRITLDTNVEVSALQNGLPRSLSHTIFPYHVLEIKTRRLRPNLPFAGLVQLQQVSFSKFMIGLGLLQ